jgi:hypothetical protein
MPVNLKPPCCRRTAAGCRRRPRHRPGRHPQGQPPRPAAGPLDAGRRVAGVFTQNRFCAAPVQVCREHLAAAPAGGIRALVVNTGIANAGTGEPGLRPRAAPARRRRAPARLRARQVLPFSTGVIMEPLPVERIEAGLPACAADLREATGPRGASHHDHRHRAQGGVAQSVSAARTVTVTGIAKGAGMIRPTWPPCSASSPPTPPCAAAARTPGARGADASFNCITVDGDTSTNDSFVLIATGSAGNADCRCDERRLRRTEGSRHRRRGRTGPGHRARRRGRHQVHHHRRRRRPRRCRVQGGRLRHRPLAAGEDRLLRLRPQPRPHPRRHRQRRHPISTWRA